MTSNHDMVLLCAEEGESVIWIDPRGRQFLRNELVVVAFEGIIRWQSLLEASEGPTCVHVLRTKVESMTLDRAAHLVRRRMRTLAARKSAKKQRRTGGATLDGLE